MDELIDDAGRPRPVAQELMALLDRLGMDELRERQRASDLEILTMGITFTVYSDGENIDRAWPFDIIPRLISGDEWSQVEAGLAQRLRALNHFIDDVYNDQRIIDAGIFPRELLDDSANYRPECRGISPKFGVWAHISGSDLVRDADGRFYVLEDNLRVPSGVSYVLENRAVAKRTFPELFERQPIRPVDAYTDELNKLLVSLAPDGRPDPTIVVLTPGIFNSAYFEHSFLAQRMGAELVEGADLTVGDDDCVYMKTIQGRERVDVIYRRIDDVFLDPEAFRPDSMLGVPGLMRAWKAGNVSIANAPGAGVADDKCVYAWVPDMIRFYLSEEPLIRNVPTYRCMYDDERAHVLDHLDELVLKPANESGGYGIVIGNRASAEELERAAENVRADPRNWVAQPILELSTAPTLVEDGIEPRHLDLRPFILTGERSYVTAGGLTRVALVKGSLVVNSSQGGGSKDTWIIDRALPPPAAAAGGRRGVPVAVAVVRGNRLMPLLSRVADRIYWGARYVERAEDAARVLRAFGEVFADSPKSAIVRWSSLVAVAGSDATLDPVDGSDEIPVVTFLVADRSHPNSIVVSVERSRENLRTCREVLPRHAWAAINDLWMYTDRNASTAVGRLRRGQFLRRVIDDSRKLDGILTSSMSRDESFDMWRIGRYIERADMTTRVLGVRASTLMNLPPGAADEHAEVRWMSVLNSLSALQMYQRATKGPITGPSVVRFLLFDHRFPRSVAGCLGELRSSVLRLPHHDEVLGAIDDTDRELRSCRPAADDGVDLDAAMDQLQRALIRVDEALRERYFMI